MACCPDLGDTAGFRPDEYAGRTPSVLVLIGVDCDLERAMAVETDVFRSIEVLTRTVPRIVSVIMHAVASLQLCINMVKSHCNSSFVLTVFD